MLGVLFANFMLFFNLQIRQLWSGDEPGFTIFVIPNRLGQSWTSSLLSLQVLEGP